MLSFISSSKPTNPRRATVLLIVIAAGLCGMAEVAARVGLSRFSQIHRRILDDQRQTNAVRPGAAGQPKTMLFAGNSLLLEGVNFPQLESAVLGDFHITRFVVEQTSYYDWDFGIERLLRHGVNPDYLVLCLSPGQFRADNIRGDFSARFLFDLQDIWPVSRATNARLTTASGYYFAHFSTFFGARSELRNVFIGKAGLGKVQELWHDLVTVPLVEATTDMTPVYKSRLKNLSALCATRGVRFLFLIPPTLQLGDTDVVRAGKQAQVTVLRPVPNYSLGSEYYRDNFHLNARGAEIYTSKIAEALRSVR
jgi:hypothetical protein